jgi:hypothetical protein
VNRFNVRRSMRSTSPHQHCTRTEGALDLNAALGSGRTGRGMSAIVDFGGERHICGFVHARIFGWYWMGAGDGAARCGRCRGG